MDALRTELRAYLWDGEFRDTVGARVTANGQPHHPYAVFRHVKQDSACVVVANYEAEHPVIVHVALDSGQSLTHVRLVDDPNWQPITGATAIPPRSAAVFITM
jgi:hypothetical protein